MLAAKLQQLLQSAKLQQEVNGLFRGAGAGPRAVQEYSKPNRVIVGASPEPRECNVAFARHVNRQGHRHVPQRQRRFCPGSGNQLLDVAWIQTRDAANRGHCFASRLLALLMAGRGGPVGAATRTRESPPAQSRPMAERSLGADVTVGGSTHTAEASTSTFMLMARRGGAI